MPKELILRSKEEISRVENGVDSFSEGLRNYLTALDLPSERILVENEERMVVINNVPNVVAKLDEEIRKNSMYISKFIAACGAGLFDAALNFLWNETVVNLRNKVVRFDMNYFLNSVIQDPKRRSKIKNEEDLKQIDDWELIKGCKDTGIITDIGFKHLDYIRDMRNYASAAHPNHNNIDGLQLSSWLQTCIKEVLAKEPEGAVIEIKTLLNNLRTNILNEADITLIAPRLERVPEDLIDSLLRAVFGMYLDKSLEIKTKNNLNLINKFIWENATITAKKDIGIKYAWFSVNADIERKNLAKDFLISVNGLAYLSEDQKTLEMDGLLDSLEKAHYGWNNFHNEVLPAQQLSKYIPATGEVPVGIEEKYIKVVINCAIGNGYGISNGAYDYYNEMIAKFQENHFKIFCKLIFDTSINAKLQNNELCKEEFHRLSVDFRSKTINPILADILDKIISTSKNRLSSLKVEVSFKEKIKRI